LVGWINRAFVENWRAGRLGIRVIAERFGVNPSTVQRINRPFDGASVAVA
jgi:IS30 family transposase